MRPKQITPIKREQLLNAARELMVLKGYAATSVDEICAKAKVTKGVFFYYFKNKEDLALVLVTLPPAPLSPPVEGLNSDDPRTRVLAAVDRVIRLIKDPNTTIKGQLFSELSFTYPSIRKVSTHFLETFIMTFAKDLKEAQARYGGSFDPQSVAELFMSAAQGSLAITKVRRNDNSIQGLQAFKRYLQESLKG